MMAIMKTKMATIETIIATMKTKMAVMKSIIAIMISKKGVKITLWLTVLNYNWFNVNEKEFPAFRGRFLTNLEASHCQPIYEANQSIRSHLFRGVNDHVYRVFPKPGSQRKF